MDNLVLIRVAAALGASLRGAALRELRDEARQRFRLIFEGPAGVRSLVVSLRPELPWIGRPVSRTARRERAPGRFARSCARLLHGAVLRDVEKPARDRLLLLDFSNAHRLVLELATHGANAILLRGDGSVVAAARRPGSARARIEPEGPYRPPAWPEALFDPFLDDPRAVDAFVRSWEQRGETAFEALRRHALGLGSEAARLVVEEAASGGRTCGEVLVDRLTGLRRGSLDPAIEATEDPWVAAQRGDLDRGSIRLLPWEPPASLFRGPLFRGTDPAATAGMYHEALERQHAVAERASGLRAVLEREIGRTREARSKALRDLASFEDPERHRVRGEALLAGLHAARRVGEAVIVPDPYDASGGELVVPADPARSLQESAAGHFRRHRRAVRGLARAGERARELEARLARLEGLRELQRQGADPEALERLERAMRAERIPVGLEPPTRAGRAAARAGRPRLEGVRLFASSEGSTILAGRAARDNHRLTFRLAAPDDFWLHALGRAGAHVVLRNEERRSRPPRRSLLEAAAIAAWFSDARRESVADVQWTRRKYVRKARGASPGTVVLKRFETVRVRPGLPPGQDSS